MGQIDILKNATKSPTDIGNCSRANLVEMDFSTLPVKTIEPHVTKLNRSGRLTGDNAIYGTGIQIVSRTEEVLKPSDPVEPIIWRLK